MADLSAFAITQRWPPAHPDRIQYYGRSTPNGVKVSIMLEETGLPYDAYDVDIDAYEQKSAAFESLNPNGRIPAIIDPDGPEGKPFGLFESGAILFYLAEKTGRFLGENAAERWQAIQWLMFQMGGIGPMFGQVGFFHRYAGRHWEDKRARDRYVAETKRLLGVIDGVLSDRDWFLGAAYSIADISMLGWVNNLVTGYRARDLVGFDEYRNVAIWLERGLARPAVQRGLTIPPRRSA